MITRSCFIGAVVLLTAVALGLPPAYALVGQGRGRGPDKKAAKADKPDKADQKAAKADKSDKADKKAGKSDESDVRARAVVVDRDGHVRIVREYARGGGLPPGLAKRESLPPGLRKQLRERGTLPPGLQKHLVPVPAPLLVRLPAVPRYYQRYFAGDDLIVVDTRTDRIVAIIRDVWQVR